MKIRVLQRPTQKIDYIFSIGRLKQPTQKTSIFNDSCLKRSIPKTQKARAHKIRHQARTARIKNLMYSHPHKPPKNICFFVLIHNLSRSAASRSICSTRARSTTTLASAFESHTWRATALSPAATTRALRWRSASVQAVRALALMSSWLHAQLAEGVLGSEQARGQGRRRLWDYSKERRRGSGVAKE
jgi:hypothetical protein